MIRWRAPLAAAFLWAAAAGAGAADLVLGTDDRHNLSGGFSVLEDPSGQLALADVLKPPVQEQFRPLRAGGRGPNFGLSSSAWWLRVEVDVPVGAPRDWLLEYAYAPIDQVDVYWPDGGFGFQRQRGGDSLPFAERLVRHRNHVFPLHLKLGANTLYLRVQSQGTVSVPVTLWRPAALWAHDQATYAALSLYFGLLLGLLLYNLLLWVSTRERAFLAYVAFVAAMGIGQAALSGLGAQFLWPALTWWNTVSVPAGLAGAALFGLSFARSFLSSAARMPQLDKLLLAQMAGWGLALLAGLALPYRVSSWMVTALAPVTVVTMAILGVISIRRNFAGARYFFTAWAVLLLGVALLTLHNVGVLPSNWFTANALLIGSALEMVLLSFALGDRINVARRFKEVAQARIAAEHAMVEALRQSQDRLQQDITARKQLEEQLRHTMSEREAILNNSVAGIVLSVRRRHEWVNEKFAQMLGYPRQVLIGQSSLHIHPDEATWLRFGEESRAGLIATNGYTCERQLKRRSGELFWVEMGGSCVRPHDPDSGVIWTVQDITGRKKSEQEVREALEQQKTLNELRTRFVAMTSHEFRTPLAAILSAEEVLRHYGDRLSRSERSETLDGIAAGVQRMSRMIDRVLLLGKAESRMLEFAPHLLDLPRLCRQLVDEARAQHPDSRCQVLAEWGAGVGHGRFDDKLLRHIFGNLLSNAIKYSPGGGQVRFAVRREGAEMVFEVRDHGIGIPADEMPHLFASFHRASNVGSIQGTGLGLAIVKNAVEVHRGRIEVESVLGRGTTFTVRLPVLADEEIPAR